jgi:hypothetical protein
VLIVERGQQQDLDNYLFISVGRFFSLHFIQFVQKVVLKKTDKK